MSIVEQAVGEAVDPSLVDLVKAELRRLVGKEDGPLAVEAMDALFPTGKLLRPVLCLESAAAVGGDVHSMVPFAAGLQCVHVASLVHDDIIDRDPVRRGKPSTAEQFGINEALLVGDGLVMIGASAMLDARDSGMPMDRMERALRVAFDTGREMCRAAFQEAMIRGDLSCGIPAVLEVVHGKTAALFGAACQAGAVLADAPGNQVACLREYGEQLGVAFQLRDDLLPYTSDEHTAGKTAISDIANRQPNLPVLLAYDAAGPADRQQLEAIFRGYTDVHTAHAQTREILVRTGAIDDVIERARTSAERAQAALAELPPSASRDRLTALAATAVDRDR
ncbi:geranylgeranyl diphosphate synthase type I [Lentzea atacamensis]|uniref:Geranylgeranyl diphosphate synthase type I n=1 Tax=Lentzea atacamensis TaxID=531938 RepID=A0ABX9E0T0_9PSEU|nr:polyprenyl synthetase family protein [Lentzea atacamensis]RAS60658.1 geranylgeranyl diphosphate synthase type I [Lentzea atacamensis]